MLDEHLDLSFKQVERENLKCLNAAQISHYNSHGFLRPFDIFALDEVVRLRAYVNRLMTEAGEAGAYGINCYQARLAGLWDIANDRRILDHVEDIVGPDIICWASAILSKRPHDPKQVPWHQDASFWRLTPARTVTVWLAIDDVDEGNSAMMWIPGTHDKGRFELEEAEEGSVFHIQTKNADSMGTPVFDNLKAGQISMHADMIVHGSCANRSDRRRCGLTLRYCPPEVRIVDEDWANGVEAILCRGADPSGNWKHHPRPDNDDITKTSSPHVVGNN